MSWSRKDIVSSAQSYARAAVHHANSLSTIQRIYACLFFLIIFIFTAVFVTYHAAIFATIESFKAELVDSSWKWTLLVLLTAACSFPPLIGYATSVTLCGYVFGFLRGWAMALLGSVLGATLAFLVYRSFLREYAVRMSHANQHFKALSAALDGGWTLLILIRLCPFPFSLSNAALSTIPSVSVGRFVGATLVGGVRLSVHAFVGSRLADLASNPDADRKSRIVSTVGIVAGLAIGLLTGYVVFTRTKRIANRLSEDRESGGFHSDQILPDREDELTPVTSTESDSLLQR